MQVQATVNQIYIHVNAPISSDALSISSRFFCMCGCQFIVLRFVLKIFRCASKSHSLPPKVYLFEYMLCVATFNWSDVHSRLQLFCANYYHRNLHVEIETRRRNHMHAGNSMAQHCLKSFENYELKLTNILHGMVH